MTIAIEKHFDENVREREDARGRVHTSTRGRWLWVVVVDGVADEAFDRKREAVARVAELRNTNGGRPS